MRFDESKYPIKAARIDAEEYAREKTIPFVYDPQHNYAHDVDAYVPAWVVPEWPDDVMRPGAAVYPHERPLLHRSVRVGRNMVSMPLTKYVRAVDPCGNVLPLLVSTITPGPEHPTGDDGQGTEARVRSEKLRRGFLILEGSEYMFGRTGNEFLAWALAVAEKRRVAHARYERAEEKNLLSPYQRQQIEAQKESREDMRQLVGALTERLNNPEKPEPKARRKDSDG